MKKILATVLAAGALAIGVAGPASAAVTTKGTLTSSIYHANGSLSWWENWVGGTMTKETWDSYLFGCSKYGVPEASTMGSVYLSRIKGHSVTAVWYSSPGYHDSITCN